MELNRPYGESAEDLERVEDEQARREVAVRLVAQAMDTCAMCACALWCIMETLDANAKKADECAALLGEVAELLRGGNNEAR